MATKRDMKDFTECIDVVICVKANMHHKIVIKKRKKIIAKRGKQTLKIIKNSLVNKTKNEKVKYLISKIKLTH